MRVLEIYLNIKLKLEPATPGSPSPSRCARGMRRPPPSRRRHYRNGNLPAEGPSNVLIHYCAQRFVFIGNDLKDTDVLFSCPRDGFLHLALNAVVVIVRPCGVGVPGPPGYGDIGGGAIGLMMSDGSIVRGLPFTRMNPPGAAAAVKPLAEGIIL